MKTSNERWSDYPESIVDLRRESAEARRALTLFDEARRETGTKVARSVGFPMFARGQR